MECVAESMRWETVIPVSPGSSASEALLSYAKEHGVDVAGTEGAALAVGVADFAQDFAQAQGMKSFFARRETAYGRAADQAAAKLADAYPQLEFDDGAGEKAYVSSSFVVLQSEGMNQGSGKYEVAVLSVRSPGLDALVRSVSSGAAVEKSGVTGVSVPEWAVRSRGLLCGSRLLFDEEGTAWFVGGASRGLANAKSKSTASLKSRGLAELFAKKMALRPVAGKTFSNLYVRGMRGLASGTEKDDFTGGFRCYSVFGATADSVAASCRSSLELTARNRKEAEEAARRVAAKEAAGESIVADSGSETLVTERQPAADSAQAADAAQADNATKVADAVARVPTEDQRPDEVGPVATVESQPDANPSDAKELAAEEEDDRDVLPSPAEKAVRDLCSRQKWCIGWDVGNARIIQIGLAEFQIKGGDSRRDPAFFEKREDAVRRAIAEAMLKISCQLSFDAVDMPVGKTAVTVDGASLMTMSEGRNQNTGNYQVAVLVTWSKAFEKVARFTSAGKPYAMPLGKDSVRDWIARLNPTMLVGSRKYIDYKGNCWLIGTAVFRWSDTLLLDERSRCMDRELAFVKEMLALGCHAEIVLDRSDYDLLMSEFRSLSKESEINRILSGLKLDVKTAQDRIRGEKELLDRVARHPATGELVRVIVHGLTASLATNARD